MSMEANQVGDIRAGEYLVIEVTDTGCGMTPEVKERAFEPFFTTKAVGKGTGLGLSQIFGFAHQSGGEVGIESQVGKGTTVSIYLPRHRCQGEQCPAPIPRCRRSEDEMTVPGARILLVEDDPRVRTATVGALEDLGYEPVACASGAEALALFDSMEFDLVISDVIMPEMTGPEMVRELKSRRRHRRAVRHRLCRRGRRRRSGRLRPVEEAVHRQHAGQRSCQAPSRGGLADRARSEEPRQQADRRQQRVPLLPRLQFDVRPGVAIDLPGDIFGAAGIGALALAKRRTDSSLPSIRRRAQPPLGASRRRSPPAPARNRS